MSESINATGIAGAPAPVLSFGPLVLPVPGRAVDLQMRVSAPATGGGLPVILLSHGHGPSNQLSSLNGYAPLASYWAAHGFAVIQPTHLDSKTLGRRDSGDPEAPLYWRSRAGDMTRILDQLDMIEAAVPRLPGRLDRSRVAVAGHSMGGHTASLLLGARLTDPRDGTEVNLAEPRIKAGVLLAAPGRGGDALSEFAAKNYRFFSTTDFSEMTTPALVIAGDKDASEHLTVRGRPGTPTRTFFPPAPSPCSPCSTQSTGSAGSPDTTPPRPRTRTPGGWPPSRGSPGPTSAPSSTPGIPPGRPPGMSWRPAPTRSDGSNRSRPDSPAGLDQAVDANSRIRGAGRSEGGSLPLRPAPRR